MHKTPYSWLLFQPEIEMQIPKIDQSLISTLDLWKSRSIAFCHRLYMESKKFLLSTMEKLSEPFGRGSRYRQCETSVCYFIGIYWHFGNIHPYFNLYKKAQVPYHLQHVVSSFQTLRFALSLGFRIWNSANFSLKSAPGATFNTNPQLGSSPSLGNEVWERNHRHPSGLATVSDRSWAKSSVYTGDYPGGLCGAPGAGAGQGTLLPVRPWGSGTKPRPGRKWPRRRSRARIYTKPVCLRKTPYDH